MRACVCSIPCSFCCMRRCGCGDAAATVISWLLRRSSVPAPDRFPPVCQLFVWLLASHITARLQTSRSAPDGITCVPQPQLWYFFWPQLCPICFSHFLSGPGISFFFLNLKCNFSDQNVLGFLTPGLQACSTSTESVRSYWGFTSSIFRCNKWNSTSPLHIWARTQLSAR